MYYLGIDIGGTYLKYAVLDECFSVKKSWKKETLLFEDKDSFYDYLCEGLQCEEIEFVGISVPGVVHPESLKMLSRAADTIAVIYETYIGEEIEKRLRRPVYALNDAKAAAYCELRIGNGQNTRSSAYWLIGTGIGGCICYGEKIIDGADGIAGEFSHIPAYINENGMYEFGNLTSVNALIDLYNQKVEEEAQAQNGREVCFKYLSGDDAAKAAMNQWIQNHVKGLYILTSVYNPEVICIGGGISEEDWFVEKLKEMYFGMSYRFSHLLTTKIVKCRFRSQANLIGAVVYAQEQNSKKIYK